MEWNTFLKIGLFPVIYVKAGHCLFRFYPNVAWIDQYIDKKPTTIDGKHIENKQALRRLDKLLCFINKRCIIQKTKEYREIEDSQRMADKYIYNYIYADI